MEKATIIAEKDQPDIGAKLRAARDTAGLSQEQFAGMLDISRQTLSAIENGKVGIDSRMLLEAARILGCGPMDILAAEPAGAVLYRTSACAVPSAGARSRFSHLCRAYGELADLAGGPERQLPPPEYRYQSDAPMEARLFAKEVAKYERERLSLGQLNPIENVFQLLEANGVNVLAREIEDGVSGMSAVSRRFGICVLVNTEDTMERRIFTLAHEYGHLLMHRDAYSQSDPGAAIRPSEEIEAMADEFAGWFLVPAAGLRDRVEKNMRGPVTLEDVVFLKHQFRVSAEMMLKRLAGIEKITRREHEELKTTLRRLEPDAKREYMGLRRYPAEAWEEDCRFQHLAREAALKDRMSISALAELLTVPLATMRQQIKAWRQEAGIAAG